MILIDRYNEQEEIEIILTSDGRAESGAILLLKHDETRKEFTVELGNNTSPSISRYDLFLLDLNVFSDLPEGLFSYRFKNPDVDIIFEVGKLYVKPERLSQSIPSSPQNSNDIPVFKN